MKEIKFRRPYIKFDGSFSHFSFWGPNLGQTAFTAPSTNNFSNAGEDQQYTGFQIKDKELFDGDIVREEISTDGLDEVRYAVVTWIKEWGMWACLLIEGEYQEYMEKGVEALDETMFWTFPMEDEDNNTMSLN